MRKAYVINTYDVSKLEGIFQLYDAIEFSSKNDDKEDQQILMKYIGNKFRKYLGINNKVQLARSKSSGKFLLLEFDVDVNCNSSETKRDENGYYTEVEE